MSPTSDLFVHNGKSPNGVLGAVSVKTWEKPRKSLDFEDNKTTLAGVGSSLVICGAQGKGDVPWASCLGSDHFTLATS